MYYLAAPSLPPDNDENSGKMLCLILVGREGRGYEWIGTEIRTRKMEENRVLEFFVIETIGQLR